MFSLAVGFAVQKRKRSVTLEGADTSSSRKKRPRQSPSDEEAQQDGAIVLMGSLELASNVTPRIPARPDWRIRTGFRDARPNTGTPYLVFFF